MTYITDDQRRKVAARLREMAYERPRHNDVVTNAELFCILGVGVGDIEGCAEPRDLYRLADLIDRPTCHDVSRRGKAFACSECGAQVDTDCTCGEPLMWFNGAAAVPRYCPSCGAEVVA